MNNNGEEGKKQMFSNPLGLHRMLTISATCQKSEKSPSEVFSEIFPLPLSLPRDGRLNRLKPAGTVGSREHQISVDKPRLIEA